MRTARPRRSAGVRPPRGDDVRGGHAAIEFGLSSSTFLDHRQPALRHPDRPRCAGRLDDCRRHSGARLDDQCGAISAIHRRPRCVWSRPPRRDGFDAIFIEMMTLHHF